MSSGAGMEDFNKNLVNAQRFRRLAIEQYCKALQESNVDFVISPTGFREIPAKVEDILNPKKKEAVSPVFEYKEDYFTVISNCLGVPNLTVPLFENEEAKTKYLNFPGSIRMMGYFGEDFHMVRIAQRIERILEVNGMSAK